MPALKKINKRARGILGRSINKHNQNKSIHNNIYPIDINNDIQSTDNMDNISYDRPLGCLNTQPFEVQYTLGGHLGEGGFGKVYSATRIRDGKEVAVKQVARNKVPTWGVVSKQYILAMLFL